MHDRQVKTAKRFGRQLLIVCVLMVFTGCASLQPKPSDDDPGVRTITGIDLESAAGAEQVVIQATEALEYSSVKQRDPLGIIFYFPETRLADIEEEMFPGGDFVRSIKASPSEDKENVRVEIGMDADFEYAVDKSGTILNVVIKDGVVSADDAAPETDRGMYESPGPWYDAVAGPNADATVPNRADGNAGIVRQIDFSAEEDGRSFLTIGTTHPADYELDYEIRRIAEDRLQLRIFDLTLPEHRRHRPLITTRFDSALDRVTPAVSPDVADAVDFIIELREQVPYRAQKTNGQLVLHFDKSTVSPRPFAAADLPPWQQVLQESLDMTAPDVDPEGLRADPAETPVTEDAGIRSLYETYFGEPEYTGEKVALDFHETNIQNVFRVLQPLSGKNYAVDPDVTGTVTIAMDTPVPWDQVLDLILTMNGLGKIEHGEIIRIAHLSTIREEEQARRDRIADLQRRQKEQQALEPLITEYIPINYANAETEIKHHLEKIINEDRGSVEVDKRNNQIIITGVRDTVQQAMRIIAEIDKVTPQVIIEARIVEVSTDFSREIGTQWDMSRVDSSSTFGNWDYSIAMNHPVPADSAVSFSFDELPGIPGQTILNAQLNAMEEQGQGKIISSPKIVTMNNRPASIKQGFEFPYRVRDEDGFTVNFKPIDLSLEVTPQITPDDRISLDILIKKEDVDRVLPTGEPAVATNEAKTILLVDDGSTIVIGGIRKEQESFSETGFPLLRNIPILGWAFKSEVQFHEKRELLIFMTPRIVKLEQRDLVQN